MEKRVRKIIKPPKKKFLGTPLDLKTIMEVASHYTIGILFYRVKVNFEQKLSTSFSVEK